MFEFLLNPKGRVSRRTYWSFILAILFIKLIAFMVDYGMGYRGGTGSLPQASGAIALLALWPSVSVGMKRFHDRNMTGKWMLFLLAVMFSFQVAGALLNEFLNYATYYSRFTFGGLVGASGALLIWIILFVLLFVKSGTPGENKYGPDPLEKTE